MRPEEEGFLEAIRNEPHNDDLRSIYADWLEEHGDPRGELYRKQRTAALGMRFAYVPAGTVWVGGGEYHHRRKPVTIHQSFGIGLYPVTQAEWEAVMGTNPSYFSRRGAGRDKVEHFSDAQLRRFPVESVPWDDVQAFIQRLNEREQGSGLAYRLPSEEEWEYVCRGGPTASELYGVSDTSVYHFYLDVPSEDLSSHQANIVGSEPYGAAPRGPNLGRTTEVGSYSPNCLGVYDMHGNVWEWTTSDQPVMAFTNGEELHAYRVTRGGCWYRPGSRCRASERGYRRPAITRNGVGFRLLALPS